MSEPEREIYRGITGAKFIAALQDSLV